MSDKELDFILNESPDIMADRTDNPSDDDSEEEEERLEYQDHQSESEEEYVPEEISESDSDNTEKECFVGKDKQTIWYKKEFRSTKTKAKNLVQKFPCPKTGARNITNEVDAFLQIIDMSMIDDIVKYTNSYINIKKQSVEYTRDRDAKETSRTEMMALIGLLYLLGSKKLNHTNVLEIWTTDGTGIEIVRAVMSYKRFLFILRCVRFDEKTTRAERRKEDKLAAIRSTLESFVQNCKSTYSLGKFVTIDEKLQAFRGRCSFVQYIPNKPAKYGIKMFLLCDAKTFFTSNLEVYCGKQPEGPYVQSNSPTDIVKRLTADIQGSSRNLTTDNWYTSYPLAMYLLQKKITLIGTMRKNKREIPTEFLTHKNREVDSVLFGYQKDATLVSYIPKKNKTVFLLSTMHDAGVIDKEINKPEIVLDYNATKGAVDTADQMCGSYSVARISRRWPLVVFYSLLDIAGINTQILYSFNENNTKQFRRLFLKSLALNLMKPHFVERSTILTLPSDISVFLSKYKPEEALDLNEAPRKKRGRCVTCGRAKNINTTITCDQCHKHVCKKHVNITSLCTTCLDEHPNDSE